MWCVCRAPGREARAVHARHERLAAKQWCGIIWRGIGEMEVCLRLPLQRLVRRLTALLDRRELLRLLLHVAWRDRQRAASMAAARGQALGKAEL